MNLFGRGLFKLRTSPYVQLLMRIHLIILNIGTYSYPNATVLETGVQT